MKKILVYGMTYNRGGMESYVMNLYRNMDKRKLLLDFVTDFESMAFADEVLAAGSRIYYIPSKSASPIGHLRALVKLLKDHPEYDTVYFNILDAGAAFSMLAARFCKRKIIVHSHAGSTENKMRLHKLFFPLLQRLADRRLACSDMAAEFMFGTTKDVTIVNNAIKLQDFAFLTEKREEKRKELGLSNDELVILHVGRIAVEKNPLFVIRTFSEVLKIRPNAVLLYVGAGDMEAETKALAKKLEVDHRVQFLGMRTDVNELYSAADVFFLPSVYEGLGIVLIEAQASGLACVSSDGVPCAAAVTDLLERISLEESLQKWAHRLVDAAHIKRRDTFAEIEAAGFSIDKTVGDMEEILLACV